MKLDSSFASDQITRKAYSRMRLTGDHFWARHAGPESARIMEYCRLGAGASVLDFGCGTGRHALALATSGLRVTGVDYVDAFVDKAERTARQQKVPGTRFVKADCREVQLGERFDAALCLYDVVGTYAGRGENLDILANLARHLKPGGFALLSVMNLALTRRRARHVFSMRREPNRLLTLPPSRIMETTGDVFDPAFYLLDEDSNVVYRRVFGYRGRDRFSPVECLTEWSGLSWKLRRPVKSGIRNCRFSGGRFARMSRMTFHRVRHGLEAEPTGRRRPRGTDVRICDGRPVIVSAVRQPNRRGPRAVRGRVGVRRTGADRGRGGVPPIRRAAAARGLRARRVRERAASRRSAGPGPDRAAGRSARRRPAPAACRPRAGCGCRRTPCG